MYILTVSRPAHRLLGTRAIHNSSPALRKARTAVPSVATQEDDGDTEDLFAATEPVPTIDHSDSRRARRLAIIQKLSTISALPPVERRKVVANTRVGLLRQAVSLCETVEDLDGLRGVLRAWRMMGMRVTVQTMQELVGRCCNLGRPELALELSQDRMQFGLPPMSTLSLITLHRAFLASESSLGPIPQLPASAHISPSLALARLVLLERNRASPSVAQDIIDRLVNSTAPLRGAKKIENNNAADERRKQWVELLDQAGGAWAEAGRKVMQSPSMVEIAKMERPTRATAT